MSIASLLAASNIPAQAQENLIYVPVDPCRIVDTRPVNGGTGPLPAGGSRNFLVSGTVSGQGGNGDGCAAPRPGSEPQAISAYVVAVPLSGSTAGNLSAYPSDQSAPTTGATVNFGAGETIGNTTNITLCEPGNCPSDGEFAVLARNSIQHVIVDVQGYFYPAAGTCPDDMVAAGSVCIDKYEASVWDDPTAGSQFGVTTDDYPCNDDGSDCGVGAANPIYARSVSDGVITPSAHITQYQAAQACANVGKRLPTTAEWQTAAAGTPPDLRSNGSPCNTGTGSIEPAGITAGCVSTAGAFDMVGNLWEWNAELDSPSGEFTTTDSTIARMLGKDYDNSGGGTPSTASLLILDGSGGFDLGPNSGNAVMGFRCVR